LVARAGEIAAPTLLVVGEKDTPDGILEPAAALHAALPGSVLETVPGLGHALADEPGTDPAPQTAHARRGRPDRRQLVPPLAVALAARPGHSPIGGNKCTPGAVVARRLSPAMRPPRRSGSGI
jgi:hypothetical protein